MRAAVEARGLTKRYRDAAAVEELTFAVSEGTIAALIGPNGAGKSTTFRLLLGLAAPTVGDAHVFGVRYRDLAAPTTKVGAALGAADFHPARSGRQHLQSIALAAGIPPQRVCATLQSVELEAAAGQAVSTYSLGMCQRLALAGALLGDPQLLILDEPANGLDPSGARWLRRTLRNFADGGGTVLISSHDLGDLAQLADEAILMKGGRLVSSLRMADLSQDGRSLEDVYFDSMGPEAR